MKWTERRKSAILLSLHLLWGLVLWFSISKYGPGISTDSVHLLFGGMNWSEGRGLISYDGHFLALWPPLYPVLLGLLHRLTGLEMLGVAALLQVLAFILLSVCLTILFLKILPGNFVLAVAATILGDIGVAMLYGFAMVGSDYVHIALVVLFLVLLGLYLESRSTRAFVGMALAGILVVLTRYIGVSVLITGALAILLMSTGGLWTKMWRILVVLLAATPTAIWLMLTSPLYTERDPISIGENLSWLTSSLLGWFARQSHDAPSLGATVSLWAAIAVLATLVLITREQGRRRSSGEAESETRRHASEAYLAPILIFGGAYLLVLFGAASITYFNKLGGRFLLPLYLPLITLLAAAADGIVRKARTQASGPRQWTLRAVSYLSVAAVGLMLARATLPMAAQSHRQGVADGENAFNTTTWRSNAALKYWLKHQPQGQYTLMSNEPDGVAFITQRPAEPAPRKTSGPYGKDQIALDTYRGELSAREGNVYLLWIEPNPYPYYYEVIELQAIARIKTLFESNEGGVYELSPDPTP